MLIKKAHLIIAKPNNNLLTLLNEYEYKLDTMVDIILTEACMDNYKNTLINCLAYLSQMNYSFHKFRIFTFDRQLIKQIKENKIILGLAKKIEVYPITGLLNLDLIDTQGNLINLYKYKYVLCVNNDKIEIYTDLTKLNLKVDTHGNGTI